MVEVDINSPRPLNLDVTAGFRDGKDGRDGIDGTSAYVKAERTDNGAIITIEDAKGTSKISLKDGIDGKNGEKGERGETGLTGEKGTDGKDGYTPVKGIDYFDGKDGVNGTNGKDGYTPVKGTDYYTESEKTEMIEEIKSGLGDLGGAKEISIIFDSDSQWLKDNPDVMKELYNSFVNNEAVALNCYVKKSYNYNFEYDMVGNKCFLKNQNGNIHFIFGPFIDFQSNNKSKFSSYRIELYIDTYIRADGNLISDFVRAENKIYQIDTKGYYDISEEEFTNQSGADDYAVTQAYVNGIYINLNDKIGDINAVLSTLTTVSEVA